VLRFVENGNPWNRQRRRCEQRYHQPHR
jgi:hypothetical protein